MVPKDYGKILSSQKSLIFVCVILSGLLALLFSELKPASYEALVSFSVQKVNRQSTNDFQYDNYYAIQASELLGNTIVGWLESPDLIASVYRQAGLTPKDEELNNLVRGVKAKQISAHLVQVKFKQTSADRARKVAESLITVMTGKVQNLEVTADQKNSFALSAAEPIIAEKKYSPAVTTLLGLVGGLFLGGGIAFGRAYLKE